MEVYGNNPELMYYGTISPEYIRDDILDTSNESSKTEILKFERIFYPKLVSMVINRVGVKNIEPFLSTKGANLTDRNQVSVIMDSISKLPIEEDDHKLNNIAWCCDMKVLFDDSMDLAEDKLVFILKKMKIRRDNTMRSEIMNTYISKRLKNISITPCQSYTTFDKIMIESLWWTK